MLPRPDYFARRERVLDVLGLVAGTSTMLVTNRANITWLTGFTGSNGAVLLAGERTVLATDGRYRDQAAEQSPHAEIVISRTPSLALLECAAIAERFTCAYESDEVSVDQFGHWQRLAPEFRFLATTSLIAQLRIIKDDGEISVLSEACRISTEALAEVASAIRPGDTEIAIARALEAAMGSARAGDRAFPTIVATGPNSAIPHHEVTSRAVAAGDLLKIDFGARVEGYHADCTRTFVVGADPQPWQSEIHELVAQAAAAGRAALRPGATYADVDAAAREVIVRAGYGDRFTHGLGHGVGLEIHEAPLFAATSAGTLAAGVVATVEPGVYLPGRGGVRIEDTCLVTDAGAVPLTSAPRELLRLG